MLRFFCFFTFYFASTQSFGFAENVTHGYVNCMACHISPAGGGLLNDYGRSLSKELMSTWGWNKSEEPLFGAVQNLDWLKTGGDYRTIQTFLENNTAKEGRQFDMQKNIELAAQLQNLWFVGTAGSQEGPLGTPGKGDFISERHYILWSINDEIKLRAGKFRTNYGLNDPNHTRLTKAPLGFGPHSETYNLEFSRFKETDEIFISASLGRIDLPQDTSSEKSILLNYAMYFSDRSKLGANFFFGESPSNRRSLLGIYGILSPFENSVLKFQTDYQRSNFIVAPELIKDLLTTTLTLGYQNIKGLLPYILLEQLQSDLKNSKTQQSNYGFGFQWLPIPHIELQAEFKKQTTQIIELQTSDSAWFVFHFYL